MTKILVLKAYNNKDFHTDNVNNIVQLQHILTIFPSKLIINIWVKTDLITTIDHHMLFSKGLISNSTVKIVPHKK